MEKVKKTPYGKEEVVHVLDLTFNLIKSKSCNHFCLLEYNYSQ